MSVKSVCTAMVVVFFHCTMSVSLFAQSNYAEDKRILQGTWKVRTAINSHREVLPEHHRPDWRWIFSSGTNPRVTWERQPGDQPPFSATYQIIETETYDSEIPRKIDFQLLEGNHAILRGSYKIEKDKNGRVIELAIAMPSPEQPPTNVKERAMLPDPDGSDIPSETLKEGVLYFVLEKIQR